MDRPVEFTEYIKPICLPPPSLVIPDGTPCIVSGWGRSRKGGKISDSLQEVAVKLMSEERCKSYEGYANQLTDSMLCAGYEKGGRDACSGDSGGPMACKLMTPDISFSRGKRRKKAKGFRKKHNKKISIFLFSGKIISLYNFKMINFRFLTSGHTGQTFKLRVSRSLN